jgi:hypothetical protein
MLSCNTPAATPTPTPSNPLINTTTKQTHGPESHLRKVNPADLQQLYAVLQHAICDQPRKSHKLGHNYKHNHHTNPPPSTPPALSQRHHLPPTQAIPASTHNCNCLLHH